MPPLRLRFRPSWLAGLLLAATAVAGSTGVAAAVRVDDTPAIALREALRWCRADPAQDAPPSACDQVNAARGELNAGYSTRSVWVRVPLHREGVATRRWLEIGYPSLDRVRVFAPALDGESPRLAALVGDLQPFAARPVPGRGLVVPVEVPKGSSTLWLRVDSEGTLTVPLTLWQPQAFASEQQTLYALHGAYFGLLLGLVLFYLLLGLGLRDGVFLHYALYGLCLGAGLAAQNGFGSEWLWRDWPAISNLVLPLGMQAASGFGAWFVLRFLDLPTRGGPLVWSFRGLMVACFGVGIPALLLDLPGAWPFVSVTALVFCAVALAASVQALHQRVPAALPFLLAWVMLLAGALLTGLRNLGIVPTNAWTANALQIGSALELLLLAIALAARFVALRKAHADGQAQLIALKQQALEQSAQAEAMLEARVLERTAELAEANRRLRESETRMRAMANRDALTGVANRVALRHALDEVLEDWKRGGAEFAVLLLDLDGFKPVNDRHGHAVGDGVLVEIARRLDRAVRGGDVVARHGGDEFVLLLRGVHEEAALDERVRQLADAVQAPIDIGTGVVVVHASIGVARAAHSAETVDDLLRRADLAMYAAKAMGVGRWSHAPAFAG